MIAVIFWLCQKIVFELFIEIKETNLLTQHAK